MWILDYSKDYLGSHRIVRLNVDYDMSEKEEFLEEIKSRGLSSPAGIHWDRLRRTILKYATNQDGEKLKNSLIMGGSIASHAIKHKRLSEQLDWAERHGCLRETLEYLRLLSEDKWNKSTGNDWDEEHPWVKDGDIT